MSTALRTFARRSLGALALVALVAGSGCGKIKQPAAPHVNTPPGVVALFPPARATGVVYDTEVFAQFDHALDPLSVNTTRVFLRQDTRRIPIAVEFLAFANRIRLVPLGVLDLSTTYTVEISPSVRTTDGDSLGTRLSWQFTTNTLRRIQNILPSGTLLESPVAMLMWGGNGAARSDVRYDVYAGSDSMAVVNRSMPPIQSGTWVYCLPRVRWASGARSYWAVTATNLTNGERMMGPVSSFDVFPDDAAVTPFQFGMADYGGVFSGAPRTQLCTAQSLWSGPGYNSALRFNIQAELPNRRIADARLEMTVSSTSRAGAASAGATLWFAQATWSACSFTYPGPPYPETAGQLATGTFDGVDKMTFRGDGLTAFVEAVSRFNQVPGLLLRANTLVAYDVNLPGSTPPRLYVTYYTPALAGGADDKRP